MKDRKPSYLNDPWKVVGKRGYISHDVDDDHLEQVLGCADTRADGSWRPVEIKLKRADLKGVKLRTRPGYFAPLSPGSDPSR